MSRRVQDMLVTGEHADLALVDLEEFDRVRVEHDPSSALLSVLDPHSVECRDPASLEDEFRCRIEGECDRELVVLSPSSFAEERHRTEDESYAGFVHGLPPVVRLTRIYHSGP